MLLQLPSNTWVNAIANACLVFPEENFGFRRILPILFSCIYFEYLHISSTSTYGQPACYHIVPGLWEQQRSERQGHTHRVHGSWEEVCVLTQHVGHHEGGQLRVGVGVEQAVVRQGVERVARLVLHEVQQGGVGVVGGRDGGDLVVFVPCSSTAAVASALTGVVLEKQMEEEGGAIEKGIRFYGIWSDGTIIYLVCLLF